MVQLSRRHLLFAAGAAAVVSMAGCGDDDADNKDLADNRVGAMDKYGVGDQFKATSAVSFSMLYNNHPNYPFKDDWLFWSELLKRTGVKIEPVAVPLSDYEQKRSVLIGAGDAPFIIPKTYHPQEDAYVSSGAILPVSDYLDLMPHFKDRIEKWNLQPEIDSLRQEDGKFYLLPGLHEKPWQDYTLAVRMDILEELKIPVPTTWDEVYDMLKAMKAAYPDVYPFSDRFGKPNPAGNLLNMLAVSHGLAGAGWAYQHTSWDANAKKFVYTGASDKYKAMLEFLHKLVDEKLLDPETFTQTDDQARQKLASGKSFVISANAQSIVNDYRPDMAKSLPNARMAKIPFPIGPVGPINPASRLENGVMISKKARDSKNFVAMMQFIDWLWYSDAGQEFARWGVEGTTYTKDSAGKRTPTPDVDVLGLNPKGTKHLQKDFGFYNGIFAYGGHLELVQSFFSAEEMEFQKVLNERPNVTVAPPHPLSDTEREQVTLWETPLKDYVYQNTLKFTLGQRPLGEWDAYVTELNGKNMGSYVDVVNKAYDRYQQKHG
ncbi:ABC transporter substrate-binding protein [Micromonospora narathiwatensis]|uniref:Carbohydrate ABC transporter substrate-binding protein, CUT1 family (TC 3.A.1.1.-) n=1 Tax=Micromonospora narathiwatensis TaxID=299146 RepID=A0A1A8ZPZ2_9ACTN|nr:extracellular solute-binding protein [Micromonospora narathiwatensis]SBT46173.1 carbohydrate ABC transporter substrate-binding protein, CUT1 family (TC 3.A.1.1.-) [Micromonospora narathiwatensis]